MSSMMLDDESGGGKPAAVSRIHLAAAAANNSNHRESSAGDEKEDMDTSTGMMEAMPDSLADFLKEADETLRANTQEFLDELKHEEEERKESASASSSAAAAEVRPGAYRASGGLPSPEKERRDRTAVSLSPYAVRSVRNRPKLSAEVRSGSVKCLVERPEQAEISAPTAPPSAGGGGGRGLTRSGFGGSSPSLTTLKRGSSGGKRDSATNLERLSAFRARASSTAGGNAKWTSSSRKQLQSRPNMGGKSYSFKSNRSKSPAPAAQGGGGEGSAARQRRATMSMVSSSATEAEVTTPGAVRVDGGAVNGRDEKAAARASRAAATTPGAVRSRSTTPSGGSFRNSLTNSRDEKAAARASREAATTPGAVRSRSTTPGASVRNSLTNPRDEKAAARASREAAATPGAVHRSRSTTPGGGSSFRNSLTSSRSASARSRSPAPGRRDSLRSSTGSTHSRGLPMKDWEEEANVTTPTSTPSPSSAVVEMKPSAVRAMGPPKELKGSRSSAPPSVTSAAAVAAVAAVNNYDYEDVKVGAVRATGGTREGKPSGRSRSPRSGSMNMTSSTTSNHGGNNSYDDDGFAVKPGAVSATGGTREGKPTGRRSRSPRSLSMNMTSSTTSSNHGGNPYDDDGFAVKPGAVSATGGTREGKSAGTRSRSPPRSGSMNMTSSTASNHGGNHYDDDGFAMKPGAVASTGGSRDGGKAAGRTSRAAVTPGAVRSRSPAPRGKRDYSENNRKRSSSTSRKTAMKDFEEQANVSTPTSTPIKTSSSVVDLNAGAAVAAIGGPKMSSRASAPSLIDDSSMTVGAVRATGGFQEGKTSRVSAPSNLSASAAAAVNDLDVKIGAVRATGGAREGKANRSSAPPAATSAAAAAAVNHLDVKIGAVRAAGGTREGKPSRASASPTRSSPAAAAAAASTDVNDDDNVKIGAVRASGGAREGKASRPSQAAIAPYSNHGRDGDNDGDENVKPGAVAASGGPRIAKRGRPARASEGPRPGASCSSSPAPQGKGNRTGRDGPAQVATSRVSTDIEEGAVVVTAAGRAHGSFRSEQDEHQGQWTDTDDDGERSLQEGEVFTVPVPPQSVDGPAVIKQQYSDDSGDNGLGQSKKDIMNNSFKAGATMLDGTMKDQSKAKLGTYARIPEEDSPNLIEAKLVDESGRISIYIAEEHDPDADPNPKRTRRIAAGVLCCVAVAVAIVLSVVLTYDYGSEVKVTYPWEDDDTDYEKLKEECLAENADNCATHCAGIHGIDMYLADKCCAYAGRSASILAFEEDAQWEPRLEEFYKCTGARIRLEYLPEGEDGMANALRNDLGDDVDHEQGNAAGQGLFDAYIVQAPWLWPVVNGLENLTPRIRENADTVKFLDINPASRSAVSYNGTVRALPLDSDYIALGWRQDVFHRYNVSEDLSPPRTIEDLASLAEELNGLDFNEDGEPDWGVCLTPQVNYFYAFVAPIMQSSLKDPFDGTPTGQNMFFSADTFEPLIHQPAFKTALEVYYKIIRNSNCGEQLANGQKCDRKTAFPTGRCAMVISMPGTLTKMLLDGAKYAPVPRTNETTGEVLWDVNDMPLGSDGGTYWGRRAPFPGSRVVQEWDTEAGYPLVECADNDGQNCPAANDGINFAPFFAEGGEAYAINGRQSSPATKTVMWDFFTWLAELPEAELPLSGQYRLSHLNEAHREELTEHAGWPNQMVDDIFNVLGEYFKSEENGGNPVQDLLMLGFPEYMGALDEELHDTFLGVKKDSSGGVFNPEDPNQSLSPSHNVVEFNQAFDIFVESLEARYSAISASISGGRMGQLQRWRSSLNLPWRTEEELCVSALSSNEVKAFNGLQCSFFVSFETLCQTEPEAVANLDEELCESFKSGPNLGVIIPSIIIPLIVLALVGGYCYGKMKKREAESRWQIQLKDLEFDEPKEVIGHGRFGEVVLATYRGSRVAVKTMKPISKSKDKTAAKEAVKGKFDLPDIDEEAPEDVSEISEERTPDLSSSSANGHKSAGKSSFGLTSTGSFGLLDITKSIMNSKGQGRQSARDKFIKEIRLLTNLQEHRNIVCVMGAVVRGTKEPKLVLEWMEKGSLSDFLRSDEKLGGKLILNILSDVAQGLLFLHSGDPKIVHSDLKSSNILIDDRFRAKVSDFGWGNTGTPYWTAPEVLRGETPYTTESDVYALGITLYEIYSRCYPYEKEDTETVLEQLQDPTIEKAPPCPATMSLVMKNMMKDCISPQAHHRPTLQELVGRIGRLTIQDVEYQTGKNDDEQILFPANVATELAQGRKVEIQTHDNVSVVYCEIADFGKLFGELPPVKFADLIQRLNDCFDEIADDHVVFKVEMMGGAAWLGATNCVQHQPTDHVTRVARFALKAMEAAGSILIDEEDPDRGKVKVQTAFTSGQVKGKVVGFKTKRYSLSGQAVNTVQILARQMCTPGRIVCGDLEQIILSQEAPDIPTEKNSSISVAGKHSQLTYWVNPPRPASSTTNNNEQDNN